MKIDVSLPSAFWTINFRSFGHKLTTGLSELSWPCPESIFEEIIGRLCGLKKVPDFEENFPAVCRRKLSVRVKTAPYVLERKIWGQSLEKELIVQVLRTNNFVGCCEELFGFLLVTAFLVFGEKIGGILNFRIKLFRPYWTLGEKSSASWSGLLFRCPVKQIEKNNLWSKKGSERFWTFSIKISG